MDDFTESGVSVDWWDSKHRICCLTSVLLILHILRHFNENFTLPNGNSCVLASAYRIQKITSKPRIQETWISGTIHTRGANILHPHSLASSQLQTDGSRAWWGDIDLMEPVIFVCIFLFIHQKVKCAIVVVSSFGDRKPANAGTMQKKLEGGTHEDRWSMLLKIEVKKAVHCRMLSIDTERTKHKFANGKANRHYDQCCHNSLIVAMNWSCVLPQWSVKVVSRVSQDFVPNDGGPMWNTIGILGECYQKEVFCKIRLQCCVGTKEVTFYWTSLMELGLDNCHTQLTLPVSCTFLSLSPLKFASHVPIFPFRASNSKSVFLCKN